MSIDADPTIAAAKTSVSYIGSDGYRMEVTWGTLRLGGNSAAEGKTALLEAHRETTRLLALFGFADEAKAAAEEIHEAMAKFHASRAPAA